MTDIRTARPDFTTDFGKRALDRLETEAVIWLTTVGADLTPQASPVWFLWEGDSVLIYSQPNTPKVRNVKARPRVSLNFNSSETGGDVVVMTGNGIIDTEAVPASENAVYIEKYADGLRDIGMTAEEFAKSYSVPIRVRPTSLRGF